MRARGCVAAAVFLGLSAMAWLVPRGSQAAAEVRLDAAEFVFRPKEVTAPPGEMRFGVKNEGAIEHNFVLEDRAKKKLAEIPVIEAGQTLQALAALGTGTYVIYCSLPGHREAGMVATLKVP